MVKEERSSTPFKAVRHVTLNLQEYGARQASAEDVQP
jgi:hypothetical protein